jgi:predicted metal-binding protein
VNKFKQNDCEGLINSFETLAGKRDVNIYFIDIKKICPLQSIRLKCQIPLCEYYGVCKTCPPHIPSVAEFKEALLSYSMAFLVVLREKITNIDNFRNDFSAELKLAQIVSDLEFSAFQHGFYQAVGLSVGGCKLCKTCTPQGEPCRHPFKARPSPEGFGIDITQLAREAGLAIEWPPKQYVNFLGLVLV